MVGHETSVMDAFEQMKQTYAKNPDDLVPALLKFSSNDLDQRAKNAQNPFSALMMQQEPPFFARSIISQGHEWAYKQGYLNTVNSAQGTLNDLATKSSKIGSDPSLDAKGMLTAAAPLFDILGKQVGSLTGSAHQEWASEIEKKGGTSTLKSMFDGAMESQPVKAYALTQEPEFSKFFNSKDLLNMQSRSYAAIGAFNVKMKNQEVKSDIIGNQQMMSDVMNGKAGYSAIDAAQKKNTLGLSNDFYNYLKDISLNVTKGTENNSTTKEMFKSQFVDEAVKLGFKLPGQFASVDDQNNFLAPKINEDLKSLYKFRDDLLSAHARNIISPQEFNTYNKQLLAPLMAGTLKNHDPNFFDNLVQDPRSPFKETDPSKIDNFRSPYNIIERGLKYNPTVSGGNLTEGTPEYAAQKAAYYDAYFKALDGVKPGQLNVLGRPYDQTDVAHAVLGEEIGDVKMIKGQSFKIAGYDPKDGMPLLDTPKEWKDWLNNKGLKEIR